MHKSKIQIKTVAPINRRPWPAGCLSPELLPIDWTLIFHFSAYLMGQNSMCILLGRGLVMPHTICAGERQDWRMMTRQNFGAVKILEVMTEQTERALITTALTSSQCWMKLADDSVISQQNQRQTQTWVKCTCAEALKKQSLGWLMMHVQMPLSKPLLTYPVSHHVC